MLRSEQAPDRKQGPGRGGWRSILALVLLGAVGAGCFSAGLWQLERAAERDALHQTIEHGRLQAPLALSAASSPDDFLPWRAAVAQGRWLPGHTVLLQNRNLEGRPGYWVATPLMLAPAGNETAVLVLRGWLPRDMQAIDTPPAIPLENGLVQIDGELHTHVPRIFELWEWAGGLSSELPAVLPQADGEFPQVQNLELADYARATGLRLLPTILAQTAGSVTLSADTPPAGHGTATELRRDWPGPSLDSDQNRGYALQWFSFCAIAVIAALFVIRGMLRRRGTPGTTQ